jgi:hypothetical protein
VTAEHRCHAHRAEAGYHRGLAALVARGVRGLLALVFAVTLVAGCTEGSDWDGDGTPDDEECRQGDCSQNLVP